MKKLIIGLAFLVIFVVVKAQTSSGNWTSPAVGAGISYKVSEAGTPVKDVLSNYLTVVYLKNLNVEKIGGNTVEEDVNWLLSQGYRVIELDYNKHANAVSPKINNDIISINDALNAGSFCTYTNCSKYRSYVLFEGYRIARDVPYFKDIPSVYNYSVNYTVGDSLRMDIIYPANPSKTVPVVLSFSYSNSYFGNINQRLNLGNTLSGFDDSFLEGAPARGIAWAIADHPKFCDWGKGKPTGGANDTYKSYEVNPDAAQKVKSAVRTLRNFCSNKGMSDKIGIYGFSRGSDAGSIAIGDRIVPEYENAGFHQGTSDDVQAAALGSGVFDFTKIYKVTGDGDSNLETRCPWAWGALDANYAVWEKQGSAYLAQTSATAPVLFFYNTDDAGYYQQQITYFKSKLDSLGVTTNTLTNYGTGHAVPKTEASLKTLYDFFDLHLIPAQDSTLTVLKSLISEYNHLKMKICQISESQIDIHFYLNQPGKVEFKLFDLSGKEYFSTSKEFMNVGNAHFVLNSKFKMKKKIYLIEVKTNQDQQTIKFRI